MIIGKIRKRYNFEKLSFDIALILLYEDILGSGKRRWVNFHGRKSLERVKSIRVRESVILAVSFLK